MKLLLCLLGLAAVISAQAPADDGEQRRLCKRDEICERTDCEFGLQKDDNGCIVCECADKPPVIMIDPPAEPMPCATPMCAMDPCPYGLAKNQLGCDICKCAPAPVTQPKDVCKDFECPNAGAVCMPKKAMCIAEPCDPVPTCSAKPLCHHQRDQHLLGGDDHDRRPHGRGHMLGGDDHDYQPHGGSHGRADGLMGGLHKRFVRAIRNILTYRPDCEENGQFKPQQCHLGKGQCWCVDDRGFEIEGSRKNVQSKDERLNHHCAKNQTKAIHGKFHMQHDLENVHEHIPKIKEETKKSLSHWLLVEDQYIVQVEVTPSGTETNILEVEFQAVIDEDGNVDLASAVYMMYTLVESNQCSMDYNGHKLSVPPKSLQVQHKFQPALPHKPIRDRPEGCFLRFYRHHQAAALAGIIGTIFFLIVLSVLVRQIVKKKRQGQSFSPMKNFRENLAFTNQLYGKLGSNNEEKKPIPDNEVKPATEA